MINSSTFITNIHSYVRSTRIARRGSLLRPDNILRGLHKEYLRMPRIALPEAERLTTSLTEALQTRTSCSECVSERSLSLSELGTLLGNALGMRDGTHRHYPSGGALYPVETYLIGNVLEGYPSGVFHYHPQSHALEFLWETPSTFAMADAMRSSDIVLAPILIVFTSVWNRSSAKYGDLAYSHSLIEAGHMAENISLVATALSLGSRSIAGYDDRIISSLLDLDERLEQPIYSVLLYPSLTT